VGRTGKRTAGDLLGLDAFSLRKMKNIAKLPPHRALLRALRQEMAGGDGAGLRGAIAQVQDWDDLLQKALAHGVFPSLYRRLADTCPGAAPPEVLAAWRRIYLVHGRRNLKLTGELLKVLALFESQGITAIPLKGPVLAHVVYGGIALRQFYDLDLLVRPQDMLVVKEVLISAGYRPLDTLTPKQERLHFKRAYELSFVHPNLTELDIHWRFPDFLGGGLDADTAFARKIQVSLEGKPVYSLAPEDMLLFLCLHGSFDAWPTLSMVNDVARLVYSQETWDWTGLMSRADRLGMRRRLLLGLFLAKELLEAPVPAEVTARANADPVLMALYQQIRGKLLAGSSLETKFGEKNLFQLKIRERLKDKLAFAWVRTAVSQKADWWWVPLPDYLYWLYPLIRPLRLTIQYFISAGGRK
jgi:hypothetical protein